MNKPRVINVNMEVNVQDMSKKDYPELNKKIEELANKYADIVGKKVIKLIERCDYNGSKQRR